VKFIGFVEEFRLSIIAASAHFWSTSSYAGLQVFVPGIYCCCSANNRFLCSIGLFSCCYLLHYLLVRRV